MAEPINDQSDIVERLRLEHASEIEHEAADEIEILRHVIADLLDYTDRHRVTWAEHDHDCFELWCIEREYARTKLPHDNGRTHAPRS